MTREDATALAEGHNASDDAGHWFVREREDGEWEVVRVAESFTRAGETCAGQEPKRGPGPDPAPTLPGGVSPWAAGT